MNARARCWPLALLLATAALAQPTGRPPGSSGSGSGDYQPASAALDALAATTPGTAGLSALAESNDTGTGALVRATSPALVTPDLGAATGTSLELTAVARAQAFVGDLTAIDLTVATPTLVRNTAYWADLATNPNAIVFDWTSPLDGEWIRLELSCSAAVTLTVPSSYRVGAAAATTTVYFPAGEHGMLFLQKNGKIIRYSDEGGLNNVVAGAPGVTDDVDEGYQPGSLWVDITTNPAVFYVCQDASDGAAVWTELGASAGAAWGSITGTLSTQSDLQSALNAKAPLASPTFTGTVTLPSGQALIAPALGTIASGVGTALTALNGENIQNDTIDDDALDFGTGTDQISAGDLPIADTGAVFTATDVEAALLELAKVPVKSTAASYTVGTTDPREAYGGVITVTSAATITAPAAAAGMSFTVITHGAIAVSVDVNAADLMWLDGVALDDGDKATNTSTTGDIIVLTYFDATGWNATSNGWTDGGA